MLLKSRVIRSVLSGQRLCVRDVFYGSSQARYFSSSDGDKSESNTDDIKPFDNKLLRELCAKIRFSGPITIAEYMREVLTNPIQGVYMGDTALGAEGHFVTSPEISQMFGECIGVWLLHEWMKMGSPSPLQIVELGPGKGTLMNDVLRTISQLKPKELEKMSLHLVEVSSTMKNCQKNLLCGPSSEDKDTQKIRTKYGPEVTWHESLRTVPKAFSIYIAHEFLDALPIHKFLKKKEGGWREVLIDVDNESQEPKLRYIISRNETPSCVLIEKTNAIGPELEMCPQAGLVCKQISERIVEYGGIGLLADYGANRQIDSFRAYRHHKQVNPLDFPGDSDLTADVDFRYLQTQISDHCAWFGPVTQAQFLHSAGIGARCEQLLKNGEKEKTIVEAYNALTSPNKMGRRFKFVSLFPRTMEAIHKVDPPVGFDNIYQDRKERK
eukprot:TRINITY_DN3246_c0_g1_i4.p1 TRINITY_DN3246_c0_g1~~TRINITY_DN3246_c0_g1_i4.p1  ORF type:complete len:450 (-),score=45.09 TRINITY_DN3246_c0_g1_i4:154-1470(-)